MDEWRFTVCFNSPAFLGTAPSRYAGKQGEDRPPQGVPYYPLDDRGVRIPTLRGALAFWHRAWLGASATPDQVFRSQEKVFGSANGGQGVSIRPVGGTKFTSGAFLDEHDNQKLLYLGYGPLQSRGTGRTGSHSRRQARDVLEIDDTPRFRFAVRGTSEQLAAVKRAVILLHLFGGMGARSRRGWGSVSIEDREVAKPPKDSEDVPRWIQDTLRELTSPALQPGLPLPRFTALSREMEIHLSPPRSTYRKILHDFSERLKDIRSDLAINSHGQAKADARRSRNQAIQSFPERVAFGLPFQPSGEDSQGKWKIEYGGRNPSSNARDNDVSRRSSPLLLKVLRLAPQSYVGLGVLLKSEFFGDFRIEVGAKGKSQTIPFDPTVHYQIFHNFFRGWTSVTLP